MTGLWAIDMSREALYIALLVSAPVLLSAMIVGILISVLQAVTQIQEQVLAFVVKLFVVGAVGALTLPWGLRMLTDFTIRILQQLPTILDQVPSM